MTQAVNYFCTLVLLAILVGCAAVPVAVDRDPEEKLRIARALYDSEQRPIPAEKNIQEAIEIYEQQQNRIGLADAYRQYGFFFRAASLDKFALYYRDNGFMDRSASFETRYDKSFEYFEKARDIYTEQKKYDALTNLYLNIGFTYQFLHNPQAACPVFDQMIASYSEHLKARPNDILYAPAGYANLESYMAEVKKKGGC